MPTAQTAPVTQSTKRVAPAASTTKRAVPASSSTKRAATAASKPSRRQPGPVESLTAAGEQPGTVVELHASGSTTPGATTAGSKIRGYEGQMYYTVPAGAEALFANIIDFDLDVKADSIDATDRSTTGWKDKDTGLKEWSGTLSANAIQNGVDLAAFYAALTGGLTLSGSFRPQDITAGLAYTGSFVVTSYKHTSKQTGMQTIDLTIEGRGALLLATVTTPGS